MRLRECVPQVGIHLDSIYDRAYVAMRSVTGMSVRVQLRLHWYSVFVPNLPGLTRATAIAVAKALSHDVTHKPVTRFVPANAT